MHVNTLSLLCRLNVTQSWHNSLTLNIMHLLSRDGLEVRVNPGSNLGFVRVSGCLECCQVIGLKVCKDPIQIMSSSSVSALLYTIFSELVII